MVLHSYFYNIYIIKIYNEKIEVVQLFFKICRSNTYKSFI